MPYVKNPICFLCKKIHSKDTNDIIQLANEKYEIVNVCNHHPGIVEEYNRQENLKGKEKVEFATKILSTPKMKKEMSEYMVRLSKQYGGFLDTLIEEE